MAGVDHEQPIAGPLDLVSGQLAARRPTEDTASQRIARDVSARAWRRALVDEKLFVVDI
jgi:hypothetical protein